ncbi:unnamed protein product (macronuclear) [Paramecium tetraurelia]|uniref:CTLH domain-containing protein n=1 Tax=Paramecium tetraurelia TaxID=5888 RepID=A0EIR4_PARTE|nr:uncharacterized protein GSPATT00027534001 [Paramecium tetraurelia]CAK95205.1 unnamed protein product [Paramecium tetraurelia]|eukprot:XP_001462578.1 hypothetical protein (macronuclear) [Paramecium tetraurelia strain d4-2]
MQNKLQQQAHETPNAERVQAYQNQLQGTIHYSFKVGQSTQLKPSELPPKVLQQNPTTEVRRIKNKSISQHIGGNGIHQQVNYYKQPNKRIIYDSTNCLNPQINRSSSNRIKKIHSVSSQNYESFIQNLEDHSRNNLVCNEVATSTELNEGKKLFTDNKTEEALKIFQTYQSKYGLNPDALYLSGLCYMSLDQEEKYIEQFQTLIKTFPTYKRTAYMYLAICLKKNNHINEAINVISQGITHFNRYFEALIFRAKLFLKHKCYDKAMKDFNSAIHINPRKPVCYVGLSDCYKQANQLQQAIEELNKAIEFEEFSKQKSIVLKRFTIYLETKEFEKAKQDMMLLLEISPNDSEVYYFKGILMQKQKRLQDALLAFEQSIKFNSEKKPVTKSLYEIVKIKIEQNDYYSAQHELDRAAYLDVDKTQLQKFELFVEGAIYLMKRKFEEGTHLLTEMITKNNQSDNLKFQAHQYRAYGYFCQSKYNLANQDLELYQENLLEKASLYNKLLCHGIIKYEDNELEQSKREFFQAHKMLPNKMEPLFYQAIISIKKYCSSLEKMSEENRIKYLKEALDLLERAAKICEQSNLLFYKGILHFALGNLDQSAVDLEQAIEKSEDNQAQHYYVRGLLYCQRQLFKQAVNDFSICLSLDQNHPESYLNRCKLLTMMGDVATAYLDLQKYIELKEQYSINYHTVGILYFLIGAYEEAIQAFADCKTLEGQYEKVKVLIYGKELNSALNELSIIIEELHSHEATIDKQMLTILKETSQQISTKILEDSISSISQIQKGQQEGLIFRLSDIYFYKGLFYTYLGQYSKAKQCLRFSYDLKEKEIKKSRNTQLINQNTLEDFDFTNKTYNIYEHLYNCAILDVILGNIEEAFETLTLLHEHLTQIEFRVQLQILMELLRDDLLDTPPEEEFSKIQEFQLFPQHNRLCSIYPALQLPLKKYSVVIRMSFCLPIVEFPSQPILFDEQLLQKISPKVVENKPEAPWIKRSNEGVIFTDNIQCIDDLDLQSTVRKEENEETEQENINLQNDDEITKLKEKLKLDDQITKKLNSILQQIEE